MKAKINFYQTSWRICFLPFAICFFLFAVPKALAQKPELVVQTGHSFRVTPVSFSPDGKYIVTGSEDKTAKLWEVATGHEIRTFSGHTSSVNSVGFSPEGKYIVTGSGDTGGDRTAKLWEVATGQEIRTFHGHSLRLTSVGFSPDGKYIVTGSEDKTARLWEVATGKKIRTFSGHSSFVNSVSFSPEGKYIVTGSHDKTAKLWEVTTGKKIRTFSGHSSAVASVSFSPEGKYIVTGSQDSTAKLWEVATGQEILTFRDSSNKVNSVSFSPDGKYIVTGNSDNTAKLWEVATGREIRTFGSDSNEVNSASFSPEGKYIVTGGYKTAKLWEVATGREIRTFRGHSSLVFSVSFSPGGEYIATGNSDNTAKLWEVATGREIRTFRGHFLRVTSVSFSPEGKYIATGSWDNTAKLWETATGQEIRTFRGHSSFVKSVSFSPDGKYIVTGSHDNTAKLWEVATGQEIRTFRGHSSHVASVSYSPEGKYIATGSWDNTAKLWEVATGQEIRTFSGHSDEVTSVSFSPDGKYIVTGSHETVKLWEVATGREIRAFRKPSSGAVTSVSFSPEGKYIVTGSYKAAKLWEAATGQEIRTFSGHSSFIFSVSFSPNGKYIVTGSIDATTQICEVSSGRTLATLISIGEKDWAVTTPDGLFDASEGAEQYLHFVEGLEIIGLNQLKERYYEPGLLAKLMGYNKEPLLTVKPFTAEELYPEIALTEPEANDPNLKIHLNNRGGGIGRVVVSINGKEISNDVRQAGADPNAKTLQLTIPIADHPYLISGKENVIEVKAFNSAGYLASRNFRAVYKAPAKEQIVPPHLWAIVAGVSDYRGQNIDLRYAAKDAMDVSHALQIGAQRLFGVERLHLKLLTTEANTVATLPTKANLLQAFREVAKAAKSTDILVVYLAGHGINYGSGQEGDYYYLLNEALSGDLNDPEVRKLAAISSAELTELIKQIPALKQVLILDTCASGRVVEKLSEKRDLSSSQIRALERMKDRTGMYVLAGAAADAVSYEASRYGQGLLTYSLLLGMRGAALRDDEFIDVSKLFQFSADQVPELAKDIGGIQRPLVAAPRGGTSFDIGRVTSEDKTQIPIASPRPLVLRANFQDDERFIDHLGLTTRINNALREISARGRSAPLIFVDASEFPAAYSLAGRYRLIAETLRVKALLFRGDQKVGEFTVAGNLSALEQLATDILSEAEKQIVEQ